MKCDQKRLYMAMANMCISQAELCKKAGISVNTLLKIKAGKTIRPITFGRLAKTLGVSIDYLMERDSTICE